jgi:hypothetical protein
MFKNLMLNLTSIDLTKHSHLRVKVLTLDKSLWSLLYTKELFFIILA